ncbi:MAG TPA: thiamine pyrophosphate-requiring protein [Solirubrobacteraceae bacterium]|nr:thiamine pyrophosphate-requiring protein [Solirubrobacteraceae bacterium]
MSRLTKTSSESGTVAAFLVNRLHEWGVTRIWGYPGDGINGLVGAFHEVGDKVEFTQCRHEELAAFKATAQAKLTGEVGVCMATSGPGAIHLLNGLYDAKLDHQAVVAIVGQQKTFSLGGQFQQEVDLNTLFKDVCSEFVQVCMSPSQTRHLVDRAVRIAKATRSPTCIIVPADVQEQPYSDPPREHGAIFSGRPNTPSAQPRIIPPDSEIAKAAEVLNAGEKVAMLIGQGAKGAADEVKEVADLLGCGVAKALNGRAALPDDLPYVTGAIGLLGSKPTDEMIDGCDTLLMVGSSFPYSEWLPEPGEARGVQIDIDARMIALRYPMEVGLVGDAQETLRALIPRLQRKADRSWREHIEHETERWWEILADRAHKPMEDGLNPTLVFHELSPRLPDRCIVTADSGSSTNWWARNLKLRDGMDAILSGTLATMGPAVPYATAAKMTYPDRPVIACVGDGTMQMNGISELIDIARLWRDGQYSDPRLIVLVLNNHDLNQVTWEQRVQASDPKMEASQDLPDFPYAGYAELLGLKGIRVEEPGQVAAAWEEALSADRPVVFEAVTDPEFPPLPPHIKMEQAKKISRALMEGDENRGRVIKESLKQKVAEFTNR